MKKSLIATKYLNTDSSRQKIDLIGYDLIINRIKNLINSSQLPQVNMILAPYGSGKRLLAERVANITLGSDIIMHPDLLIIDNNDKSTKKDINVDSARSIKDFLNLTPYQSDKKVVIIDSLDQLNIPASNSLLKVLEEPRENIFFYLICHCKDNVLDTILSRSHVISLPKLSKNDFFKILLTNKITESDGEKLYKMFPGQPGKAILFYQNKGFDIFDMVFNILNDNKISVFQFMEKFNFKQDIQLLENLFSVFGYCFNTILSNHTDRLGAKEIRDLNFLYNIFVADYRETINLNLDRGSFILNTFKNIKKFYDHRR